MGKKFEKLEHGIAHEYEKKGYSNKEAERVGKGFCYLVGKGYRVTLRLIGIQNHFRWGGFLFG